MTFEKTISAAIREAIKREFPGSVSRKRHVVAGVMGDPDIYGMVGGYHFELEVKQPGKHPTKLQHKRLAEWSGAGAIVGVAHSVNEAIEILREGTKWRLDQKTAIPDDSEEI